MLFLKEINFEDIEEEFDAICKMPEEENGFINKYYGISRLDFEKIAIPSLIESSKGINLEENHVAETYFFLWDDNVIVGLFKIRHSLNNFLRTGPRSHWVLHN